MQRSPDLEEWTRKLFAEPNVEEITTAHSMSDDAVLIGTDEAEWFEGGDAIASAWRSPEGLVPVQFDELRCYEEGTVAWMVARARFQLPDGSELPARITGVAHKEGGDWKIVQSHASTAR